MPNSINIKQWRQWVNGLALAFLLQGAAYAQILEYENYSDPIPLSILNSMYRETNLCLSPNKQCLYFMSDRGEQPWSQLYGTFKGKPHYDGDLWMSCRNQNGAWQTPQILSPPINTAYGEDEPNFIASDTLLFQSWREDWATTDGPYYIAIQRNDKWELIGGLGGGITQFFIDSMNHYKRYATDGALYLPKKRAFLFAAGPIYDKEMDLYIATLTDTGWSYPQKLPLSTPGDERSLFLFHNSLFFASNSYGGFGGLDIFYAQIDSNFNIQSIYNLGPPFNTPANEYGFILAPDSSEAFFVRNGDIYYVNLKAFVKKELNTSLITSPANPITYKVDLFFDFDQDTLPPSELQKIHNYQWGLLHAKSILIEGHTDTIGTIAYNQNLGLRRALFVKHYLISKLHIPETKIQTISYGEQKAIPTNPDYSRRATIKWSY